MKGGLRGITSLPAIAMSVGFVHLKYSLFFLVGSKEPLVIFLIRFRIVESNDYLINEGILKIIVVYFRKIPLGL